jgi:hypothetical protein
MPVFFVKRQILFDLSAIEIIINIIVIINLVYKKNLEPRFLVGILKILYCKEDPLSERVQEFLNVVAQ